MSVADILKAVAATLAVAIGGDYMLNDGKFATAVLYAIGNML